MAQTGSGDFPKRSASLIAETPAIFSLGRRYRYLLRRRVGFGETVCLFIMLNPSTADETQEDPTVRRCMDFAQRWGFGILEVVNLFGLRSTDPAMLRTVNVEPVGPDNDYWILSRAMQAARIVCAWGNHGSFDGRSAHVVAMMVAAGVELMHFGLTKCREPRHPLYLPKVMSPMIWITPLEAE